MKKGLSKGWWAVIIFGTAFWIVIFAFSSGDTESLTPEQIEAKQVEKHFSPFDGSHLELTKIVKSNLKDPDSYQHIETTYRVEGDTVWVFTNYRAKNSLDGIVIEGVTGITDKNTGDVIEWIQQQK